MITAGFVCKREEKKRYAIVCEKVCLCVLRYLTVNEECEFVSVSEKERVLSIGGPAEACGRICLCA